MSEKMSELNPHTGLDNHGNADPGFIPTFPDAEGFPDIIETEEQETTEEVNNLFQFFINEISKYPPWLRQKMLPPLLALSIFLSPAYSTPTYSQKSSDASYIESVLNSIENGSRESGYSFEQQSNPTSTYIAIPSENGGPDYVSLDEVEISELDREIYAFISDSVVPVRITGPIQPNSSENGSYHGSVSLNRVIHSDEKFVLVQVNTAAHSFQPLSYKVTPPVQIGENAGYELDADYIFYGNASVQGLDAGVSLNVRNSPNIGDNIAGTLWLDDELEVLAQDITGNWYFVTNADGSALGWASRDFIQYNGNRRLPILGSDEDSEQLDQLEGAVSIINRIDVDSFPSDALLNIQFNKIPPMLQVISAYHRDFAEGLLLMQADNIDSDSQFWNHFSEVDEFDPNLFDMSAIIASDHEIIIAGAPAKTPNGDPRFGSEKVLIPGLSISSYTVDEKYGTGIAIINIGELALSHEKLEGMSGGPVYLRGQDLDLMRFGIIVGVLEKESGTEIIVLTAPTNKIDYYKHQISENLDLTNLLLDTTYEDAINDGTPLTQSQLHSWILYESGVLKFGIDAISYLNSLEQQGYIFDGVEFENESAVLYFQREFEGEITGLRALSYNPRLGLITHH